jgi:putative amidase
MINIEEISILKLQDAYEKKQVTCKEVVLYYLDRIAKIDKNEGGLNSIIEINPDALFIADKLDEMRSNGTLYGYLHGIPILLKDNINTKDRMRTSAGSMALEDNFATYDAHIVKLLRQKGALILGKTNMTEFANAMSDRMPGGFSSRGGQTLCPYDKSTNPLGSSTGSAVAVTANLCMAAVGTEACGSIIMPAKMNGVVGIKPTLGLLSRSGIIPSSNTLDTPGTIARSVLDAAILLEAMAGIDENDPATYKSNYEIFDYIKDIENNPLKEIHIGLDHTLLHGFEEERYNLFEICTALLRENGAICKSLSNISMDNINNIKKIGLFEFKTAINSYFTSLNNKYKNYTLKDIITYNQNFEEKTLKYDQNSFIDVQENMTSKCLQSEYIEGLMEREKLIEKIDKIFVENEIDVLFSLTGVEIADFTGFPSMTIPIGVSNNNWPIGIVMISRRYHEKTLIKVGHAFEQIFNARKKPYLN